MTIINAIDATISFQGKFLGCVQSSSFNVSREMDEATCAASNGWAEFSPGQKSWTASIGAILREFTAAEVAANVSFDDIFDMLDDGDLVTIEFNRVAGGPRYSGTAYVSEIGQEAPDKGVLTWSASFTGSGPISRVSA